MIKTETLSRALLAVSIVPLSVLSIALTMIAAMFLTLAAGAFAVGVSFIWLLAAMAYLAGSSPENQPSSSSSSPTQGVAKP